MKDLEDLLQSVHTARKRLGISRHPAWFRGHAFGQYTLTPSLLRSKLGLKHERNLMSAFITKGKAQIPETLSSSWDNLALMQHHGTPTRLLDWTESVYVALFFAVWEECEHPTIWVLNPFRMNELSVNRKVIFDRSDPVFYDYLDELTKNRTVPHKLPIAMFTPWIISNPRIERQKGCFTVHGSDHGPIEEMSKKFVKRVNIPRHIIKEARKFLRDSAMDDFSFFPDLDGLSRSLIRRFRLDG